MSYPAAINNFLKEFHLIYPHVTTTVQHNENDEFYIIWHNDSSHTERFDNVVAELMYKHFFKSKLYFVSFGYNCEIKRNCSFNLTASFFTGAPNSPFAA